MKESPGSRYFDIDGDDQPPLRMAHTEDSDKFERYTWRGDPRETGSDCTVVVITSELKSQTYHVHKQVLCWPGPRQSKFFAKSLKRRDSRKRRTDSSSSSKGNSIKVELEERDAENFPIVLDFMYTAMDLNPSGLRGEGDLRTLSSTETSAALSLASTYSTLDATTFDDDDLTAVTHGTGDIMTDNAVSLRFLARKFENEGLTRAINRFIQKDLTFATGPKYLCHAYEYKDQRLMGSAQRLCAENMEQIDKKALLKLPVNLFRIVIKTLENYEKENEQLSLYLSGMVCSYLDKHPQERSAALLLELTDPLFMPYIAPEAAIGYTAIVKDLDTVDASTHWSSLLRLCQRCAKAVVKEYGWSDFSVQAAMTDYLGKGIDENKTAVDNLLFATSFASALEQAQHDYGELSKVYDDLSSIVTSLHASAVQWEAANQRKDDHILKQNKALENSKQEITRLKRELAETRRNLAAFRKKNEQQPQPRRNFSPSPQRPVVAASRKSQSSQPHRNNTSPCPQRPIDVQRSRPPGRYQSPARYQSPLREQYEKQQQQRQQQQQQQRRPEALRLSPSKELISPAQVGATMTRNRSQQQQQQRFVPPPSLQTSHSSSSSTSTTASHRELRTKKSLLV